MIEMFEKLILNNNERSTFEKYITLKGAFLHKQVYDVIIDCDQISAEYSELSSIIRYDKSLRDQLYIYLATFEECLRADIFTKYDVNSQSVVYKKQNGFEQLQKDIKSKTDFSKSNLYYCYELEFWHTIKLVEFLNMYDKKTLDAYDQIRLLRNKVMHHNMLIFGSAVTENDAKQNLEILQQQVQCLCDNLPKEYKSGFVETINSRTGKRYLSRFCLGDIYV